MADFAVAKPSSTSRIHRWHRACLCQVEGSYFRSLYIYNLKI